MSYKKKKKTLEEYCKIKVVTKCLSLTLVLKQNTHLKYSQSISASTKTICPKETNNIQFLILKILKH